MITLNDIDCYPIWKDIEFNAGGTVQVYKNAYGFEDWTLLMSGECDEDGIIRINEIVAPFVRPSLSLGADSGCYIDGAAANSPGAMPLFTVIINGWTYHDFFVFSDWSYDYNRGDIAFLPCPIDGVTVEGQYMLFTGLNGTGVTISKGGSVYASISRTGGAGPGTYFKKAEGIAGSGAEQALTAAMSGGSGGSVSFKWKRDVCARYVVYYVNAYGGWDWFVIQGKTIVSDTVNREDYSRKWASWLTAGKQAGRERELLTSTVKRHYEMHTHWLSDDEASRMWHLTESQVVYIHDLETGIVMPAIMTGNSHEYKTYRNQDGKLVSYQLDMDVAIDMIRR